jgi:basic membrane protein A
MYKNLAAALAAACFFPPFFPSQSPPVNPPVKAGFVYVSPITDAGWTRQHDEGRKAVEAALGSQVKTTFVENVPEGADAERVIRDLARHRATRSSSRPALATWSPRSRWRRTFPT